MDQPEELILRDVRCFQGEQRGKLRPITLLIGENSTGKSTFLGCLDIVHQMLSRYRRHSYSSSPNFNQEPFSMLFSDIKVKRHGKQISDPFQLQAKVQSGSHVNMMDVGYGVSQSLPILVKLLASQELKRSGASIGSSPRTFLLQQPEVHLHPRGQAELASLFVKFSKKKRIVL